MFHLKQGLLIRNIPKKTEIVMISEKINLTTVASLPPHVETVVISGDAGVQVVQALPKTVHRMVLFNGVSVGMVKALPLHVTHVGIEEGISASVVAAMPAQVQQVDFSKEVSPIVIKALPKGIRYSVKSSEKCNESDEEDTSDYLYSSETERRARAIPILNAVGNGDLKRVEQLIASKADVNVRAPGGKKTALHLAAQLSYPGIVAKLIEAKADVNAETRNGSTPLKGASQVGDVKIIDMLVKAGADQNSEGDVGCTPLHEAASNGHSKAVQKLLELKADPNIRENRYNLTAADLADNRGHYTTRDILLAAMDYRSVFIKNIHYTLFQWKSTFIKENTRLMVQTTLLGSQDSFLEQSAEFQFVSQLASDVASIENADDLFKKISAAFKSPVYETVQHSLSSLRRSIIVHMKRYNQDKVAAKQQNPVLGVTSPKVAEFKEKKPEQTSSRRKKVKKKNKSRNVFSLFDEVSEALQTKREMPSTASFDSTKDKAVKEQKCGKSDEINDNPDVISPQLLTTVQKESASQSSIVTEQKTVQESSGEVKVSCEEPLKRDKPPVTPIADSLRTQVKNTPLGSSNLNKKWKWRPVVRTTPSGSDTLARNTIVVPIVGSTATPSSSLHRSFDMQYQEAAVPTATPPSTVSSGSVAKLYT